MKMKNSGVPWIGDIPEGWEVCRIKNFATKVGSGKTPLGGAETYVNEGVLFLRSQNIHDTGLKIDNCTYISEEVNDTMKASSVAQNDILLNITGASIGRTCIYNLDMAANVNQHVCIIRLNENAEPKFVCYFLQSTAGQESINIFQDGANREGLNFEQIKNTFLPFPRIQIQQRIADFLDAKCIQINDTIAKEKELIAKLKEYRQSIITEAVTKGLNPTAPMKDSGINWIGKIPKHWAVSKIKYEFDNLDSMRQPISASERGGIEGVYDYYGASGVIDKIDKYIFDEPLLLIGEDGANLIMRNLPLIYKAQGKFWVNNHAHILRPHHKNIIGYWFYSLECLDLTNFISGSAQPKLTQEKLSSIPIVVPSKEEQQEITTYLDKKTFLIDNTIQKKEELVSKFEQYKKSLIYEAVTGKIEV